MPASGRTRGRPMTIGEAVARLSEEFPGIRPETLRALEEHGLVAPERNSSGYRRYTERDLDAVRNALAGPPAPQEPDDWADALEAAEVLGAVDDPHTPWHEDPIQSAVSDAASRVSVAHASRGVEGSGGGTHKSRGYGVPVQEVPRQDAGGRDVAAHGVGVQDEPGDIAGHAGHDISAHEAEAVANETAARGAAGHAVAAHEITGRQFPAPTVPQPDNARLVSQAIAKRRGARWPEADYFMPELGEVALGREGLARAAGMAEQWLDELVAHGLISGTDPASGADLLVARAASELLGYGIEPRHLRPVQVAAGRAAMLIKAARGGSSRSGSAQAAAALVRLEAALLRAALLDD